MIKKMLTKVANQLHYYSFLQPSKLNAVFVVSTGRTGTKFFETFFSAIDDNTYAVHEPQPDFFDLGIKKHREKESSETIKKYIFEKRDPQLRSLCSKRIKRYVECNPFASILLPEIKAVFKKAKFIVITRAPETYIKSALNKSPLDDGAFYFYGEKDKRKRLAASDFETDPYNKEWKVFSRMEKIAWYWNKCNIILLNFLQKYPKDCLHIKFEEIFSQNSEERMEVILQMLAFLEVDLNSSQIQDLLVLADVKKNQTKENIFAGMDGWSEEEKRKFEDLTHTAKDRIYNKEN